MTEKPVSITAHDNASEAFLNAARSSEEAARRVEAAGLHMKEAGARFQRTRDAGYGVVELVLIVVVVVLALVGIYYLAKTN